jgi:bile acid:Na+ symporter, BASS family
VVVTAVVGVLRPQVGTALGGAVAPLLAGLILCVSLTFDRRTLAAVLRRPRAQVLATALVYGPMSLAGFLLGAVLFGSAPLGVGFALLGALPTDVSSPLLVWIARGDVALASVFNAVNTALAPVLVPLLLVLYTGVEVELPVARLVGELALTVLVPTLVGVALRSWRPARIAAIEPALSAGASLAYLALLLAVVGPNAQALRDEPGLALLVAGAALALNGVGYLIGGGAARLFDGAADRTALLFTVSKKEFSIAAYVVIAAGLPPQVALPAALYAIVQMLTSPVVARRLARAEGD